MIWLLTLTTLLTSGLVYYCQPLLGEMALFFQVSPSQTGQIPMWTQIGYVCGLFFVTPLGDVLEKKRLICFLLLLAGLTLLGAALASHFFVFALISVGIGLSSVVVQILIPFVAILSPPGDRAKNLGTVLSAALIGILLSRTLSGFISAHLGWQGVYLVGSFLMGLLALGLWFKLPDQAPKAKLTYPRLLHSIWILNRDLPRLRAIAGVGGLMYAALCVFWTSLAFFLNSQYGYGPAIVGSFGLLGAIGALSAKVTGRFAERLGPRRIVRASIVVMIVAFGLMNLFAAHLFILILGVLLLDMGAQAATVSNQTEIYRLHPEAQTRLNTIYKMYYFAGGSAGSLLSAVAWQHAQWTGVCFVAIAFLLGAGLLEFFLLGRS